MAGSLLVGLDVKCTLFLPNFDQNLYLARELNAKKLFLNLFNSKNLQV
jgi:hypothetical protein